MGAGKSCNVCRISIHALLAESDLYTLTRCASHRLFLSTLSLRRATFYPPVEPVKVSKFLSTLSLRRATGKGQSSRTRICISIHALLAESDRQAQSLKVAALCISIHALLAESDIIRQPNGCTTIPFLSTLSLRRATSEFWTAPSLPLFLSTLSLRRATRYPFGYFGCNRYFYPRSPCGERLVGASEGSTIGHNFYPRSPCGERQRYFRYFIGRSLFLSTLSLRRATRVR